MSNIVVSATGSVSAIIFVSFRYESNTGQSLACLSMLYDDEKATHTVIIQREAATTETAYIMYTSCRPTLLRYMYNSLSP